MRTQVCQGCDKEFEAQRSTRMWCPECKRQRQRESVRRNEAKKREAQGKRQPRSEATCQWCGATFTAWRSDAKTCSPECKRKANLSKARTFERTHRSLCQSCGAEVTRRSKYCIKCGRVAAGANRTGEKHHSWKGGRSQDKRGYIQVLVAPEARKGHRYRAEHILVWEAANGPVPEGHVVHHINHIKDDNRLENLVALPRRKHNDLHGEKRVKELEDENRRLKAELERFRKRR